MMKMDIISVKSKLQSIQNIMNMYPQDSTEFSRAAREYTNLVYQNVNSRDLSLIGNSLKRPLTIEEESKLIVAGANDQDITEAIDLDLDTKATLKLRAARRQSKMTQQQLAERTNISQSQIAKIESGTVTISLQKWQTLLKATNSRELIKFSV